MRSAEFRIETLRCRMLRPRRPPNRWDAPIRRLRRGSSWSVLGMSNPRAGSSSTGRRRILRMTARRARIKLSALCGLLLMNSPAFAAMDTSKMTCAQVQDYVKTHGQTFLTTGIESGNYSFDYADCGGTVPGFACTTDQAYCHVGWWCDYNYPVAVNPNVHDQGVNFCPARPR